MIIVGIIALVIGGAGVSTFILVRSGFRNQ